MRLPCLPRVSSPGPSLSPGEQEDASAVSGPGLGPGWWACPPQIYRTAFFPPVPVIHGDGGAAAVVMDMCPWLLLVPWSLSISPLGSWRDTLVVYWEDEFPVPQWGWLSPIVLPFHQFIPVCLSPGPEDWCWEVTLGAHSPRGPSSHGVEAAGDRVRLGCKACWVPFPADMRAEDVACSWACQDVSRPLLAAGLIPSSFPMSDAMPSWWVGFPQGPSAGLEKPSLWGGGWAAPWLASPFPWTILFQHLLVCLLEYFF